MLRLSRIPYVVGLVVGCCLALMPQAGRSQGANKGAPVSFSTADGVTIKGTFYPAAKRDSTCVLMLHALGANEDSKKKGWQELAQALNAKGYGVLTFDFRGHGDSTMINPQDFWGGKAGAVNQAQMPKLIGRDSLEFKDYKSSYYPVLINDIAAARAFLDRKNDAGECNSSSLVIIGAETGGTLGAIWLSSEFHRYRVEMAQQPVQFPPNPQQLFLLPGVKPAKEPEGKDVLACIWLSISHTLGSPKLPATLSLSGQLYTPAQEVPMTFLYGANDAFGAKLAKQLETSIKKKDPKNRRYEFTGSTPIPGANEKLRGRGLLQVSGADGAIVEYVENLSMARPREWMERDFRKTLYVWRNTQLSYAKLPSETTMIFNGYQQFIVPSR